jgi:hypothetical protein
MPNCLLIIWSWEVDPVLGTDNDHMHFGIQWISTGSLAVAWKPIEVAEVPDARLANRPERGVNHGIPEQRVSRRGALASKTTPLESPVVDAVRARFTTAGFLQFVQLLDNLSQIDE